MLPDGRLSSMCAMRCTQRSRLRFPIWTAVCIRILTWLPNGHVLVSFQHAHANMGKQQIGGSGGIPTICGFAA
jgi:hypothetical protein